MLIETQTQNNIEIFNGCAYVNYFKNKNLKIGQIKYIFLKCQLNQKISRSSPTVPPWTPRGPNIGVQINIEIFNQRIRLNLN